MLSIDGEQPARPTTFRIDAELRSLLVSLLDRDQVSQRRKSQWLCAAIRNMVQADPGLALVGAGEAGRKFTLGERIQIDPETEAAINTALRKIRRTDYRSEGMQAAIIRAAIRHAAKQAAA